MTATSDTIIRLISYTWTDWAVSLSEETSVIGAVRADSDISATVRALTRLRVPLADQAALVLDNTSTLAQYRNPIPGSLPDYLASLGTTDRRQQAELLLGLPIVSVVSNSYFGGLPSRAQVFKLAARRNRLSPEVLAAFVLAEQRDQSQNEDAVELASAQSVVLPGNTSIGLGQVVVSTARIEDLFAQLLPSTFTASLDVNLIHGPGRCPAS